MRKVIFPALVMVMAAGSLLAQVTPTPAPASPAPCTGSAEDAEMRIAALEGLIRMGSADAMPILTGVLKQRDPCRTELRKQAVSLVSRKAGDDALPILLDVVRNDPNTEVRSDAVFWLSRASSDLATSALDSILFSTGDTQLRQRAIESLSRRESPRATQSLTRAAEDEKMSSEVRGQAVFWLGRRQLADLDYFKKLYGKTTDQEVRSQVVQAVVNLKTSAASQWLLDLAKDKNQSDETRTNAIFWASRSGSVDIEQLASIYTAARGNDDVQNQVLMVYSRRSEPAALNKLIAVATSDSSLEMRKQALFWLAKKDDPRAKQLIRDLISK